MWRHGAGISTPADARCVRRSRTNRARRRSLRRRLANGHRILPWSALPRLRERRTRGATRGDSSQRPIDYSQAHRSQVLLPGWEPVGDKSLAFCCGRAADFLDPAKRITRGPPSVDGLQGHNDPVRSRLRFPGHPRSGCRSVGQSWKECLEMGSWSLALAPVFAAGCVLAPPGLSSVGSIAGSLGTSSAGTAGQIRCRTCSGSRKSRRSPRSGEPATRATPTEDRSLCGRVVDGRVTELGQVCHQFPPAGRVQGARLPISIRVAAREPMAR